MKMPPSSFTLLPPELLLHILSRLPLTTLLPLSQTCHFLSTFLRAHASSICNTRILTLYPQASSILQSSFDASGWYLPTHPCVLSTETQILREKTLASGCNCVACRVTLQESTSARVEERDQEVLLRLGFNGLSRACKARTNLHSTLKLSSPGPQYLLFLEKYAWEIETRFAMSASPSQGCSPSPSPSPTSSTSTTTVNGDGIADRDGEKEKQAIFNFMIGNYCVRRFLENTEKRLAYLTSPPSSPASTNSSSTLVNSSATKNIAGKLGTKLWKKLKVIREKHDAMENVVNDMQTSPATSPRRLIFGEISPQPSTRDEKSLLIAPKNGPGERWEDGLLWYYEMRRLSSPGEGEEEGIGSGRLEEEGRERGCFAGIRRGIERKFSIFGGRVGRWGRGLGRAKAWKRGCGGRWGFWALEG